ncbi:Ycf48-like protein precursor [Mucilaginibacter gotjawali]|nr:Ycf48-like protein precursor [Mucilaginibacter gotjawali]
MKNFFKYAVVAGCLLFNLGVNAQSITLLQQGNATSIRGLSVVDDHVAWISGSKGTVAKTTDGGKTWDWQQVKSFEKADFRDIEAFSDKEAVIMSSGTPALILKTTDGGASWKVKYSNADTAYFFDAMDFADKKHGYVLGDPINNKFVLMETKDGGETWSPFKYLPDALPGEAAFAASGTCLRVDSTNEIDIVTGGQRSRHLILIDDKIAPGKWVKIDLELLHGKASQGAFSVANGDGTVIVGGDYQKDGLSTSVAEYWYPIDEHSGAYSLANKPPSGFQSCVEYISERTFLSTGTPGSNITTDGGKTWAKIDDTSFNVCRKAKHGKLVLLAGNGGKIGIFKP